MVREWFKLIFQQPETDDHCGVQAHFSNAKQVVSIGMFSDDPDLGCDVCLELSVEQLEAIYQSVMTERF